jgi:hypothetical protein
MPLPRSLSPAFGRVLVLPLLGALSLGPAAGRAAPQKPAEAATKPGSPVEKLAPGVQLDWVRGVLSATGSCAADLFAASAEVARIKSERLARLRAEDRLRKALGVLAGDKDKARAERLSRLVAPAALEQLRRLDPAQATVAQIDYAATGSVSLRLELALRPSAPPPAPPTRPGSPDAGAPAEADAPGTSE